MSPHATLLVLSLWSASGAAADAPAEDWPTALPTPLAHWTFDGSCQVRRADGGAVEPLQADSVAFTEGLRGQALRAESGLVLRYERALLPASRGSVSMWVRLTRPLAEGGWRFFFSDGTHWGPVGMPRLWLYFPGQVRLDMDGGRRFFIRPLAPWPLGHWRHFAFTWDAVEGTSRLYVDGEPLGTLAANDPWNAEPTDSFRIGSGLGLPPSQSSLAAFAAIDEVTIHDQVLDGVQIARLCARVGLPRLVLRSLDERLDMDAPSVRLELTNAGHGRATGTATWARMPGAAASQSFDLGHRQAASLDVHLDRGEPGLRMVALGIGGVAGLPDQTLEVPVHVARTENRLPAGPMHWRIVADVDCTTTTPASVVGTTSVVQSPIGGYLEAGPRLGDRFVYRFELAAADRLVRVTVTYPDDRIRTASVSAWGPPQEALGSGYACGDATPLTHRMVSRAFVFFSRQRAIGIVLGTEGGDQPAAAASIQVEEAGPPLSPAAPPPVRGAVEHRRIGLYWEDPILARCFGEADSVGGAQFDLVLDRCIDYCDWVGLDVLSYPAVLWQGPVYASDIESGYPMGGRLHPPDYVGRLARRCEERGIDFIPSFNIWKLASLRPWIVAEDQVIAGRPSANCVQRNGRIITWGTHQGLVSPVASALHPAVRAAVKALVREVARQCAASASFRGIDLMLWPGCLFTPSVKPGTEWEGSFDDHAVESFAESIGEDLPGEVGQARRFVERADWILGDPVRREAWYRWRCDRMVELYRDLAAELVAAKAGTRLGIGVYDPTDPRALVDADPGATLRAIGLDVGALAREPNIAIRRFVHPMVPRYALRLGRPRPADLDFPNSAAFHAPFAGLGGMGVIFHQQYFETNCQVVGQTLQLGPPFLAEPQALEPNFGIRVSEPLASGREHLRCFALALRNFDPVLLTVGGYVLGIQGVESDMRTFARALRALPAVRFDTVSEEGDVLVRTAMAEGSRWFYAVNLAGEDRTASIAVDGPAPVDAVTGEPIAVDAGRVSLALPPYGLACMRIAAARDAAPGGN